MKEYDLYVPLHFNDGVPIPRKTFSDLKRCLISRFGGLTQFPQKQDGFWKIGAVTFRDQIIILRVLSSETPAKSRAFWTRLKTTLKKQWKQNEVLIVIKNVTTV